MDLETPERTTTPATTRLRRYDDLPGPRPYPVVGNALQLDSRASHLQMQRWCDEYGPIYRAALIEIKHIIDAHDATPVRAHGVHPNADTLTEIYQLCEHILDLHDPDSFQTNL